ncbi:MAG: sigma 54-interacting transcriptional regulator [Gammaproteobacteria bacterium]
MQSDDDGVILIVDDTPTNLQVLLSCLHSAGFKVLIATDGQQALQRAEIGKPDLILLDVVMPGMDGFETCRRLKASPSVQDIPVIFMTALSETKEKLHGFSAGAVDYVTKPLDQDEVLARIRTHLTLRKLQRALFEQNQRLQDTTAQLGAITDALTRFLQSGRLAEAAGVLLTNALSRTQSGHGILAMVNADDSGHARLRVLALAGIVGADAQGYAWFDELRRTIAQQGDCECEVSAMRAGIGEMMRSASVVFGNEGVVAKPAGFVLAAQARCHWLGLPIVQHGGVVGLLAVADRAAGYSLAQQLDIERLAQAAGVLIECERSLQREAATELRRQQAEAEVRYLREEIKTQHNFEDIIGESDALGSALAQVERVTQTDVTVLILGETGTGKEMIARAIHQRSPRKNRPLIKVNCGALPENLVESELFGHEKGAFTGATTQRKGRFELADGGTLFLDEIGDMPMAAQTKLLRVLQEREFERVGGTQTVQVDVRVLAATHRDLKKRVAEGLFREDLYYRLNVFPIELPPLRERREDIAPLVQYFIGRCSTKFGRRIDSISSAALERLHAYDWPGNVRELENIIERAVILTTGTTLDIPPNLLPIAKDVAAALDSAQPETANLEHTPPPAASAAQLPLSEMERNYLIQVLNDTHWVIEGKRGAAAILGLKPSTLRNRMQKLGIRKYESRQ